MLRLGLVGLVFLLNLTGQALALNSGLVSYFAKGRDNGSPTSAKTFAEGIDVVEFSSGEWHPNEVSPGKWNHRLIFGKNTTPGDCDIAYLHIGGNQLGKPIAPTAGAIINKISDETKCWSAVVDLVPNQPLKFFKEDILRIEDDILAYGFAQYMKTKDQTWIANLHMAKSAMIAMDHLEAIHQKATGKKLRGFVVSGQSKRGWTSWLVAAFDRRVVGVVPIVIDFLNTRASLKHHYSVYNAWSPPLKDYVNHGILAKLDSPEFTELMNLVDPFSFREQLTMPKLIVNAANDQFFVPDSSQFYFDQLPSKKWLKYVPNVGHHIDQQISYLDTVSTFVRSVFEKSSLPEPKFVWTKDSIRVDHLGRPKKAILYVAYNEKARDFRLADNSPKYAATELDSKALALGVKLPQEKLKAWYARFVELSYELRGNKPFVVTSEIKVEESAGQ